MKNRGIKAILFDFDGVIHDTFEFHRGKIKEFTGVELSPQEYRDQHNGNFHYSDNNFVQSVDWFGYRDYVYTDQAALPIRKDIRKTLLEFGRAYMLFIVTSGGTKNISDYLGNNGILKIFEEVLGAEHHRSKVEKFKYIFDKYTLKPEQCYFVTDTLGDIIEANEVNIPTIAVDFGFHDRETLERGKPEKIVSSFHELRQIIEQNT